MCSRILFLETLLTLSFYLYELILTHQSCFQLVIDKLLSAGATTDCMMNLYGLIKSETVQNILFALEINKRNVKYIISN